VQRFPIVSTLHDVAPHPGLDSSFRKKWEIQTLVRCSAHLFVHGQVLKEELLRRYPKIDSEKVHVIPHGDYAFFRRWASAVKEEPLTILFFGRIREYKGLPLLCEAYTQVLQSIPDARLIIAGEGPLGALQPILESFTNCEIYNRYIPEEEVSGFFERASMVVCPYTEASQSGIIPVAYAFKKPVVATRVGCLPESVEDGRTGFLVSPGDPAALAEALITLLRDPDLQHSMGRNGFQKMNEEFGWDKLAAKSRDVYLDTIKGFMPEDNEAVC
jgi:glycosyltransferase involved in cell wall biosynthesis